MKQLLLSTLVLASVHAYAAMNLTDNVTEKQYELYGATANAQNEFNDAYKYSNFATYSGKYVVFHSSHDNNYNSEGKWGHYVKNTLDGSVTRIPAPEGMDDEKFSKMTIRTMTANGRFLVMDKSGYRDELIYLYDLKTGKAQIINRDINGNIPDAVITGYWVHVSEDGKYVYYSYYGATLEHSSQQQYQVYLWDVEKNIRKKINKDVNGNSVNFSISNYGQRRISGDGRFLVYKTNALVNSDVDNTIKNANTYIYDRTTGKSRLISFDPETNEYIQVSMPSISIDGTFVTYLQGQQKLVRVNLSTLHREIITKDEKGNQLEHCAYPSISSNGLALAVNCEKQVYLYDYTEHKMHKGSVSMIDGSDSKKSVYRYGLQVLDKGNGMQWRSSGAHLLPGEPNSSADYQIYLYRQKPGTTESQICFSDDY
ncbi:hypothetical protein [Vibrio quintilis]|uniref:Translocation protein TolB n=1 Tax=Vibrio quintilis TaxID=1117707 RepID=A0A1M7YSW0_9VIBR|nr:hypothetical protein [Vibrio quintilis]SHO55689.1 hypothetical protein VQ7734_01435 [Vibrio quintilis]